MSWKLGHQAPQGSYDIPYNVFTSSLKISYGDHELTSSYRTHIPNDIAAPAGSYYGNRGGGGYDTYNDASTLENGMWSDSQTLNNMRETSWCRRGVNFAVLDLTTMRFLPFSTDNPPRPRRISYDDVVAGYIAPEQQRRWFLGELQGRYAKAMELYHRSKSIKPGKFDGRKPTLQDVRRYIQTTICISWHYLAVLATLPALRQIGVIEDLSFDAVQRKLFSLQYNVEDAMRHRLEILEAQIPIPPELRAAIKEVEWAELRYVDPVGDKGRKWDQAVTRRWAGRRVRRVKSCFEGQLVNRQ